MATPIFFLWIPIALPKIYFFSMILTWHTHLIVFGRHCHVVILHVSYVQNLRELHYEVTVNNIFYVRKNISLKNG